MIIFEQTVKNQHAVCGEKGVGNMISLRKVAAVTLAASVLLSMAACGKKNGSQKHSGQKITSDMPWYEATEFDVDTGKDPDKEVQFSYSQFVGSDDKRIAILTSGSYKYPDNVDWSTFDSSSYQISNIAIVDKATKKTVNSFDLNSILGSGYVESASYSDGKITLNVSDYDMEKNDMVIKSVDIDPDTGKQLDSRVNDSSDSVQSIYTVGKYKVQLCAIWTETNPIYSLNVISDNGEQNKYEFKDDTSKVTYINTVIPLNDKTGLIIASADNSNAFYEFDLATGKITKQDSKDFDWLSTLSVYRMTGCSDGNVYSIEPTGINKLDFNKKTSEQVASFSWCNIDRNLVNNLMLADVSDGSFILYGETPESQPYSHNYFGMSGKFAMYELKKAKKNPYAGKSILELYSPYGIVNEEINNAINKFNDTNKDYFIEITDRYTSNVSYGEARNDDESNNIALNYMADMSNKLSMDIMNGEGPDMLLSVDGYGALKNSNYLLDLSSYTSHMTEDKYFTNVLDALKVDGKLYNFPISYGIYGIQTDPKYAKTTGIGFTTDEYVNFLKDTLNGKDIISSGQAYYFASLFSNMNEKFIINRKADFSTPEFAALAEFVKDNVQERSPDWTQDDMNTVVYSDVRTETQKALYSSVSGYWDYIQAVENTNGCSSILGIPSSDGRGPAVFAYDSLSISAQAVNADACVEFLKLLISDEMQQELATKGYLVLNRAAFREAGNASVKYFNTINPGFPGGFYGDGQQPKNHVTYTTEHIDALEKAISSCSSSSSEDAAISIILVEEMPAYFTGQKPLDEVIKIAQDRVQKVLDERK